MEEKENPTNNARAIAYFLYEYVFTRYGLPIEIINVRGTHFINGVIHYLLDEFMVIHRKLSPYHPQTNCQAKITKKILCIVLTKIVHT